MLARRVSAADAVPLSPGRGFSISALSQPQHRQRGTWDSEGRGEKAAASRTGCLFFSVDRGFAGAGGIHLAERALFFMEEMRQRAFNRK